MTGSHADTPSEGDAQSTISAIGRELDNANRPSSESPSTGESSNTAAHSNTHLHREQIVEDIIPPNTAASRRGGRVHWDAAPVRRVQGQQGGATVTVRSPMGSGSVQRLQHPGPLGLSVRLASSNDVSKAGPSSASPEKAMNTLKDSQQVEAAKTTIPALSLAGAKGLDEQGLDNRAFLELQRELQRHEANEMLSGDDHDEHNDRATEMDHQGMASRNEKRRRYHRAETPEWGSGTTTPGTEGTSDTGSYDPHNDSDLDHIDLIPGEVDGLPARLKKKKGDEEDSSKVKGWARLRGLLTQNQDNNNEEDKVEAQREKVYEEGGPTNLKSVPVTTSMGTRPGGPRSKPDRFEREAARLIKAHRFMAGQRVNDEIPVGTGPMPTMKRDHLDSGASTPDRLDTQANLSARPVATGGILGNLLKLYEQQQREERARQKGGYYSEPTSPASTPGVETPYERDEKMSSLVSEELKRENQAAKDRGSAAVSTGSNTPRRKSWAPSSSPGGGNWGRDLAVAPVKLAGASKKVLTVAAKETGLDEAYDDFPKAARSAGGVVGALIATTGNLVGAVSPHHAQLGPAPKRPGFTLDRYLLPEMNAKTLRKTAQIVADAAPRPKYRSQPGTPGGQRTPQSYSNMARKETNDSGETQLASPPNEKAGTRPSSIVNGRTNAHSRKNGNHPNHGLHMPHLSGFARTITGHSVFNTPDPSQSANQSDYFGNDGEIDEQAAKAEWQKKLKKRAKSKRKKEEIFITMHVAAILQRQEFIMKLSRALMMFGAPTHRIETQIQQTARVLEINCRCIYLPNLMLIAFGDEATHTSETKFIKQAGGLNLTKLTDMHSIYWNVIHDKIGVGEASKQLDELMRRKPLIGKVPMVCIGGLCSAFICPGTMGFSGSFIDSLAAIPLGMFLVFCQLTITTELFSNVFEILFASINSFAAAALASTGYFCYGGVVSGSIVLILPGFIVLTGSLELQSKNLVAGSVRLVYAIIYSLFLGFGISIGSSFWLLFSGSSDSTLTTKVCADVQRDQPWWRGTVPLTWALLTVPGYSIALSLRNQAKVTRKEFPVMVLIAIAGWATNHFASTSKALSSRSDVTSALGAMMVGLLSNIFGRIYDGKSYTVACVGVLYQLPSGLSAGNGGTLLSFANTNQSSTASFNSGFQVAQGLVEVAIGLTVGLYAATSLAYVFGGRKIRGGGLFSF